jgi:hypothetical protein
MELVIENGWKGNGWMLDRLASFRREVEEAIEQHTPPRAEVVEDKDAYHHYYVEMPGLKVGSIQGSRLHDPRCFCWPCRLAWLRAQRRPADV